MGGDSIMYNLKVNTLPVLQRILDRVSQAQTPLYISNDEYLEFLNEFMNAFGVVYYTFNMGTLENPQIIAYLGSKVYREEENTITIPLQFALSITDGEYTFITDEVIRIRTTPNNHLVEWNEI